MKKIWFFLLLFGGLFCLYGQEKTYIFEKGSTLDFSLELQTKIHFDLNHTERSIPVQSRYRLKFYVFDKGTDGEAVIAAISHLEGTTILESGEKGDSTEKTIRDWLAGLKKDDNTAFILDIHGNILSGRMLWPDATCYHLPRILEGFSIKRRDPNLYLGGRYQIANMFTGLEKIGEKEYSVYQTNNASVNLRLLFDNQASIPFRLEARYSYFTSRLRLEENLTLTLEKVSPGPQPGSVLGDESMLAALIQASVLSRHFGLGADIIRNALASKNAEVRILASFYLAQAGLPVGVDLTSAKTDQNEVVRFNLAKAKYRTLRDRTGLENFLKKGLPELRERAERILSKGPQIPGHGPDFPAILSNTKMMPDQSGGKNVDDLARAAITINREAIHFGPRPFCLESGLTGKRIFHYSVYTPLDYDPEEIYPLIVSLSGGNGFSDSFIGVLKDIAPSHYILVCPDSDYAMWWERDQVLMFDDLLKRIFEDYSVDPDRIYLQGFSNGGIATYLFGYSHPDRFAAIAPLMGFSMRPRGENGVETEMSLNMLNTPLLIIHGDSDSVISIEPDLILVEFLRANNIPHRFIEVPGEGHDITFETFHKDIMNFFRRYKRNPAPGKINLVVDNPKYNRSFWIRVETKRDPQKRARVKAERKGNKIILETGNVKTVSLLLNDRIYSEGSEYEVVINGKNVFRGKLQVDPLTLNESLQKETDPARIYGVKLTFDVTANE